MKDDYTKQLPIICKCIYIYLHVFRLTIVLTHTHRKYVRRRATPDLKMFGQTVAPPPSSSLGKTCVNVEDVLKCFHDTGSPATSELSPISVCRKHVHCIHSSYSEEGKLLLMVITFTELAVKSLFVTRGKFI